MIFGAHNRGVFCVTLFTAGISIVLYVLVGYPLLLGLLSRKRRKPICKDDRLRTVSVIVPVRNGEQFLERKLHSILSLNYPRDLIDILVVSDGSDDRTDEIALSFASKGVNFLRIVRAGKAAALNSAFSRVAGEVLVLTDVRQMLDPNCLRNVIACFGDPEVGAVSSVVIVATGESREERNHSLYYRYESWLRQRMAQIDSSFGCTGAFYAIRRRLWTLIPLNILLDDVYLPLTAFFKGYRLALEPTAIVYDFSTLLSAEFQRKVRTQAGLYQILRLMPDLFTKRNRMRLHFLSAKYGRTVIPYALMVIAIASLGLPSHLRPVAVCGQGVLYSLAALDFFLPSRAFLKPATSMLRTFVVLMAASLIGLKIFFTPPLSIWRKTEVCDCGIVHQKHSDSMVQVAPLSSQTDSVSGKV